MNDLLNAVRNRKGKREPFAHGILTADRYVSTLQEYAGHDACNHWLAKGSVSYDDLLRKAAETLVYSNSSMATRRKRPVIGKLPRGVEAPKNTLMVFRHVLTSSAKDRDGDVLHSDGAEVDPNMLLLWQHVHTMPIGKMLHVEKQNKRHLVVMSCIVDINPLCHDAAVMIDNGMGRFSHGFKALEFTKNNDGGEDVEGFDVKRFEIMEESLVSVPANTDAETQDVLLSLIEGGKLRSPLMKEIGAGLRERRNVRVPVVRIKYRERLDGVSKELTCGSLDDLKAANDAGLIGDHKDENVERSGSQASGVREDDARPPKETDADADQGGAEDAGDAEIKHYPEGSWDRIREQLDEQTRPYLLAHNVSISGDDYSYVSTMFGDRAVVAVYLKHGPTKCYEVAWIMKGAKPVFVNDPKEVEVIVTVKPKSINWISAKPYPNEHAARLTDPKKYEKLRRQNNKFGEGIHAIFGILKNGKTEVQAIRFDRSKFTVAEAKKWLKSNDYKPIMFEAASGEGSATTEEKRGRVLSKTNEGRLRDALDDLKEAIALDNVPRSCAALIRQATQGLSDVLSNLGEPEGASAASISAKQAMAVFVACGTAGQRKQMAELLAAIERTEKQNETAEQFRALWARWR